MPDASPAIMPTYGRLPVTFSRGEGAVLYDTNDRAYLDGVSGIAVTNLGHQYPRVTRAVAEQASRLIHTSNLFHIGLQEAVAEQLRAATGMENMFFCNSGAEANEAAIKLARRYGDQKGIASPQIIVLDGAFHGPHPRRTLCDRQPKNPTGIWPAAGGFPARGA
jgi:acetylornithine aminotransferase